MYSKSNLASGAGLRKKIFNSPHKKFRLRMCSILTETVQEKCVSLSQRSTSTDKSAVDRQRDSDGGESKTKQNKNNKKNARIPGIPTISFQ